MKKSTRRVFRPSERSARLNHLRNLKMARSAHAYVRGNTRQFYQWLEERGETLPQGPAIWICGDCHVSNLGPVADAKGKVAIQIRDLDQTVIGNPAHDIVRLGLSLATAVRGSDLPGVTTARMLEALIAGYEAALGARAAPGRELKRPEAVHTLMKEALGRKWKHLAAERMNDMSPQLPRSAKFWPVSAAERKNIDELMGSQDIHALVTDLAHRSKDDEIEVLDVAYWVKGCSSLGLLRLALLMRVRGEEKSDYCLIDVKEAVKAWAPFADRAAMPRNNAQRVVEGARALSPALGKRLLATRLFDRPVFVRELLPQDLKLEIDQLSHKQARNIARFLGAVVGRAHARQMDGETRKSWLAELRRARGKAVEAPSWLWTSVVELLAAHERAYLEHCWRYGLAAD